MNKIFIFAAIMVILFFSLSSSSDKTFSEIRHFEILKNDCNESRQLNKFMSDYLMYGFSGNECVSSESYLTIPGEVISEIIISKNTYSNDSLNVYDVKINLNKVFDEVGESSRVSEQGQCLVYIDEYMLGMFDSYDAPNGDSLHFVVIDKKTKELIDQLERLNINVKVQFIDRKG